MNIIKKNTEHRSQVRARLYQPAAMLVHALASMPAKNAGALMAISGIKDAVPLIHGPPGCASLRHMNSFAVSSPVPYTPCTNLSEIEMVLGGEAKLYHSIIGLYHRLNPALIVVVPTCPSDMIGDDLGGIVEKAKKEVGVNVSMKQMMECWDKLVPEYDLNNRKWYHGRPETWMTEIVPKLSNYKKILDVGCGAGALSLPLSNKFNVTSMDFSLKMLQQLMVRSHELKTDVKIVNADTHSIPFKDDSFDAVICRYAIWPLTDPKRGIEEMVRVSKHRIIIIEGDWYDNEKQTLKQKIIGKPIFKVQDLYYRTKTGRDPNSLFKEMRKYHQINTSAEKISNWFEDCGITVHGIDYSIIDRVATRRTKLIQKITGYSEVIFIMHGDKT